MDAMARYFFDIHNGRSYPDGEGSEHADLQSVREEVRHSLTQIADGIEPGKDAFQVRIDVRDERGTRVVTAALMLVIEMAA